MENLTEPGFDYWWQVIILILFGLYFLVKRLNHSFGGDVIEITAVEAAQLVSENKAMILDIREKRTYEKEHIPDTLNMPGVTFIDGTANLEITNMPIIIIPMKGLTPMPVLQYLESIGVPSIYILKGGIQEWKETGLPLK